jgi:hypothetical protein
MPAKGYQFKNYELRGTHVIATVGGNLDDGQ